MQSSGVLLFRRPISYRKPPPAYKFVFRECAGEKRSRADRHVTPCASAIQCIRHTIVTGSAAIKNAREDDRVTNCLIDTEPARNLISITKGASAQILQKNGWHPFPRIPPQYCRAAGDALVVAHCRGQGIKGTPQVMTAQIEITEAPDCEMEKMGARNILRTAYPQSNCSDDAVQRHSVYRKNIPHARSPDRVRRNSVPEQSLP